LTRAKRGQRVARRKRAAFTVPKRFKVGRAKWTFEEESPEASSLLDQISLYAMFGIARSMDQLGVHGATFPDLKRVVLGKHLKYPFRDVVALHELLHVCFPTKKPLLSHKKEEEVVNAIAPRLMEILSQCTWTRRGKK
jgi:hypothetical protein